MKKFLLVVALFVSLHGYSYTNKSSEWYFHPRVSTSSFALFGVVSGLEEAFVKDWDGSTWFVPQVDFTFPIYSISSDDGAKIVKPYWWRDIFLWGDYSHTFKFAAGAQLGWTSEDSPVGFFVGADWEYLQLCLEECAEAGMHRSQAVAPYGGLRIKLGDPENYCYPVVEVGATYVYNFKYHNPHDYDLKALNNGVRGHASIGLGVGSSAIMLEYEHEFFKHFYTDHSENGFKPFESYKNTFGQISLRYTTTF